MNKFRNRHIDLYLIGVILFSLFMNFFLLNRAETNEYYQVAVKSMMKNFHNFFYASFDPAGFITVDKPPVALWLQTLSAKLFGFSGFSLLLPEAMAAVLSTIIVYQMVKKYAGSLAAFISGLTMSLTPIFIAVSRTNNMDSILILTLVIAAWAVMKAAQQSKWRWLMLSVLMVGIGFNVKMLEAFMILPAIYLFYWLAVKYNWKKKLLQLLAATVVLAGVSLSWAIVVDSIPANQHPYIGGSQSNSVLELALGYNGVARLTGQQNGGNTPGNAPSSTGTDFSEQSDATSAATQNNADLNENRSPGPSSGNPPEGISGRSGGARNQGGMFGTGNAGPLRLFSKELSGQASWMLPFVFFGIIAMAAEVVRRRKLDERHRFAIFWLSWLIPAMIFFSIAGFFHQYYLSLMAPPIAALTGLGFAFMWRDFREKHPSWTSLLLPLATGLTLIFQAIILYQNDIGTVWVMLLVLAGILTAGIGIMSRSSNTKTLSMIAGMGLFLTALAPLYWTLPSTFNQTNSSTPVAGPVSTLSGMGAPGQGADRTGVQMTPQDGQGKLGNLPSFNGSTDHSSAVSPNSQNFGRPDGMEDQNNAKLLQYLKKNAGDAKFLLAVERAQSAYSIMLNSDYAVMAMGGFSGSDPALTVNKLEKMAEAGEIKYFLISGNRGGAQNAEITEWIKQNCEEVPESEWSDENSGMMQNGPGGQSILYVYRN